MWNWKVKKNEKLSRDITLQTRGDHAVTASYFTVIFETNNNFMLSWSYYACFRYLILTSGRYEIEGDLMFELAFRLFIEPLRSAHKAISNEQAEIALVSESLPIQVNKTLE